MESLTFITLIVFALILYLVKKRNQNKNPSQQSQKLEWDFGYLEKPLKYLYLLLALGILCFILYIINHMKGIYLNQRVIEGVVSNIVCNQKLKEADKCPEMSVIYEVKYIVNKKEYIVTSGAEGRIGSPPQLYYENASVGDKVNVLIDRSNPERAIIAKDSRIFILTTIAFMLIPLSLVIHSIYLIKKKRE